MTPLILICAVLAFSDGDSGWCHREDGSRVKVRLGGMDAGELPPYTRCRRQPRIWACSRVAKRFAPIAADRARELGAFGARCTQTDTDQYRRPVVTCTVAGEDIGAILVREGLAINEPSYGDPYRQQENEARERGRGVWQ
nr:thermonuclease family protein [Brevundimonas naejangsanensis]